MERIGKAHAMVPLCPRECTPGAARRHAPEGLPRGAGCEHKMPGYGGILLDTGGWHGILTRYSFACSRLCDPAALTMNGAPIFCPRCDAGKVERHTCQEASMLLAALLRHWPWSTS